MVINALPFESAFRLEQSLIENSFERVVDSASASVDDGRLVLVLSIHLSTNLEDPISALFDFDTFAFVDSGASFVLIAEDLVTRLCIPLCRKIRPLVGSLADKKTSVRIEYETITLKLAIGGHEEILTFDDDIRSTPEWGIQVKVNPRNMLPKSAYWSG